MSFVAKASALNIEVLVASMTGTAHIVAQEIELAFGDESTLITVRSMDKLGPDVFAGEKFYILCTSTYGQGDIPDSAYELYEALQAQRPNLSHVRYGVLGLGDRTYQDTFNFGGKKLDELLSSMGAIRIGERAQLDASSGELPEDQAMLWMRHWLNLAQQSRTSA